MCLFLTSRPNIKNTLDKISLIIIEQFPFNLCDKYATHEENLLWRSSEWSEQRLRLHGLRAGQCVTQHAGQLVARNVLSLFC